VNKLVKIVSGLIAMVLALAFFAVPVLKLKHPSMIVIILIGVVAMVWNFVEVVREKED
jgi:hypothetical protein